VAVPAALPDGAVKRLQAPAKRQQAALLAARGGGGGSITAAAGEAGEGHGDAKLLSEATREALSQRLKASRFVAEPAAAAAAAAADGGNAGRLPAKDLKAVAPGAPRPRRAADGGGGGGGRRRLQSASCASGSSVFVTSSEFAQMEGCLAETDLLDTNVEIEYVTESAMGYIFSSTVDGFAEVCVWGWRGCVFPSLVRYHRDSLFCYLCGGVSSC